MFIINKCKQPNLKKIGTNDLWNRNNIYIYYFTIKNIPITTITFYHSNWYLLRNKFISNKKKKKEQQLRNNSAYFEILFVYVLSRTLCILEK